MKTNFIIITKIGMEGVMKSEIKKKKEKMLNRLIYFFIVINIILACVYIIMNFSLKKEAIEERELLNSINLDENIILSNDENIEVHLTETQKKQDVNKEEEENINKLTERILKVKKLQEENEDIVGWIEIENTNINYPVLQGDDNEYYLTHNYKKEKSQKGSIFLTKDYDWSLPSDNLLIYGHNIMNGLMFQDLLKYSDEEFYESHPIIHFTTENKDVEFEIFSVFKSRVFYKSEKNVFRYYDFVNADTEEEYNEFVEKAKESSLYDIDITAEYGEQLITLVTCSYHTEDGRFIVIGKEK